jgi:hypothetical protein
LVRCVAGDDEQPVTPGGHKHCWSRHGGILLSSNDTASHSCLPIAGL